MAPHTGWTTFVTWGKAEIQSAFSHTCPDFDNGKPNEEHTMLLLDKVGQLGLGDPSSRFWRPRFNLEKMATTEGRQTSRQFLAEFSFKKRVH